MGTSWLFVDVYSKSLVLLAQSPYLTHMIQTYEPPILVYVIRPSHTYTFVLTQKYLIPTHFSVGTSIYTQTLESEVSAVSNPDVAGRGGCKGLIT